MDQTPPPPGPVPPTTLPTSSRPAPPPSRTPRATAWALRVTLTLLAIACVAQPLSIGRYLDGDFDAIGLHSGTAILLILLTTVAGVAALLWTVRGGHPAPLIALVVLWFVVGFQMGMGFSRNLAVHVPLGVGIVAASLALAGWSWTGRVYRRPR